MDGFVGEALCAVVLQEVQQLDRSEHLTRGGLGGGQTGANLTYYNPRVRGDRVGWFTGDEQHLELRALQRYLEKVDRVVSQLAGAVPELMSRQIERGSAMVTCYPSGGSKYIRHIDNPNRNGRLLTAIFYLNIGWEPSDGGHLHIFSPTTWVESAEEKGAGGSRRNCNGMQRMDVSVSDYVRDYCWSRRGRARRRGGASRRPSAAILVGQALSTLCDAVPRPSLRGDDMVLLR